MQSPLRFQLTEFDCVPTTFVNAICWLFPRAEIPPLVLQRVFLSCLDKATSRGNLCHGTSGSAINVLVEWLNAYRTKKFRLKAVYCHGGMVNFRSGSKLSKRMKPGGVGIKPSGVVALNISQNGSQNVGHCVLALEVDDDWIYCFDPYYRTNAHKSPDYEIINKGPNCPANLRIRLSWLSETTKTGSFQLGPVSGRTCVLLSRRV